MKQKYEIGEKVFCEYYGAVVEGVIQGVNINADFESLDMKIEYALKTTGKYAGQKIEVNQSELSDNPFDVIKEIEKNLEVFIERKKDEIERIRETYKYWEKEA
jgi:Rieske Fe-S protein